MDTYESLEKVKAKFDAPTSTYSKASAIKTYQSFVASSIANSKLYKISLGEVVENIESNNRNKYIVGSHSAIQNVAKTYTDNEMSKVLDVQFSNLQNQTKDHIIKARATDQTTAKDNAPHYFIKDVSEQELKDGFTKNKSKQSNEKRAYKTRNCLKSGHK